MSTPTNYFNIMIAKPRKIKEPRIDRVCKCCARVFSGLAYKVLAGEANYCSKACQHKGHRKGKMYNCITCGELFYSTFKRREEGRGKYCSKKCSYGEQIIIKCSYCSKEIKIFNCHYKKYKTHYCNTKCHSLSQFKYTPDIRKKVDKEKSIWRVTFGSKTAINKKAKELIAYQQLGKRALEGKIKRKMILPIIHSIERGKTYAAYI